RPGCRDLLSGYSTYLATLYLVLLMPQLVQVRAISGRLCEPLGYRRSSPMIHLSPVPPPPVAPPLLLPLRLSLPPLFPLPPGAPARSPKRPLPSWPDRADAEDRSG